MTQRKEEQVAKRLKEIKKQHKEALVNGAEIYYFKLPFSKRKLPFRFDTKELPDLGTITLTEVSKCKKWYCRLKLLIGDKELIISEKVSDILPIGQSSYKFQLIGRMVIDGSTPDSKSSDIIIAIIKTINFPTGYRDIDMEILIRLSNAERETYCKSNTYFLTICNSNDFWRRVLTRFISVNYGIEVDLPNYDIKTVKYSKIYNDVSAYGLHLLARHINVKSIVQDMKGKGINLLLDEMLIGMIMHSYNFNPKLAEELIANGANINAKNGQPLLDTVRYVNKEMLQFLIGKGANVNINNGAALVTASENGSFYFVSYLVRNGANVNLGDPLIVAISGVLEKDWVTGTSEWSHDEESYEEIERNALKRTAALQTTPIVKLLLGGGADVHARDDEALILAVETGSVFLVESLLNYGANIQAQNEKAMTIASSNEDEDMIELLREWGG